MFTKHTSDKGLEAKICKGLLYSTSFVIREFQIKKSSKIPSCTVRMANVHQTDNTKCW
jgi:hypothetical protein